MKTIVSLVVFSLILLALLYFFNLQESNNTKKLKPINQVTLQEQSNTHKVTIKQPKIKQISNEDLIDNDSNKNTEAKDKELEEPELDYITAYRDWQYFENCYTDVEDFLAGKDPLLTLSERFEHNPRESQNDPTPQQNMYYQQHVDICKGMIIDEKDNFYDNMNRLEQRFKKIIPKTAQEKQLQHALEMVKHLKNYKLRFSQAHYKKSTLSSEELNQFNEQIEQLTTAMLDIYEASQEFSAQDTALIKQYSDEIEALRKQIDTNNVVDFEKINQISSEIDGYLNSMDDYLHNVESPDAFLIITSELYKSEYFQKDSNVMKTLKNKTGIYDSYYINILNTLVMPLVACSMNYPCGADSDYMLSYCLGLRDSMFNQACGLTLEDFYFNFYIGANQLNDVNNYFSYMVNRYVH